MALLVPNVGEDKMIKLIVNGTTAASTGECLMLRLFSSNTTPTSTMTLLDYTEAAFTGYASVTMSSGSWTITPGAPTSATQTAATTFTCSATTSVSVYGYYLSQEFSSILMWSERFSDGPYTIANSGDKIIITPTLTLSTT
jgi:hypothetical protein